MSEAEISDAMLMLRYQRGDREAFATLVNRHKRRLYNFIVRQIGDLDTAEELTQEAFLRVVQDASSFKHEARFSTWLYTIGRNLCVDHLRRMTHRRHASLDEPTGPGSDPPALSHKLVSEHPGSDAERRVQSKQVLDCVMAAVDALPDEQRETFLLREIANLPFKEIAEVVGTSENTVKSRMRYALERLQSSLSQFEEYARALR